MRLLKSLILAVGFSFAASLAYADIGCEKLIEPADVENPTKAQIAEYQMYSFAESLNQLYSGKRMFLKTAEELAKHQAELSAKIEETTRFFGYNVTTEQVLTCSNKNSANIDFNLLRYAVFQALRKLYIF